MLASRSASMKYAGITLASLLVIAAVAVIYYSLGTSRQRLIVSTTTSLYETGLLDAVKESFERVYPVINVSFISQGTGMAMQTAMRGDADMILVHDPERELDFLEGGYGVNRKIIAYNFFVLVGPSNDPAGIRGTLPNEALSRIRAAGLLGQAVWISRGDDSGTHAREKQLWRSIGLNVAELRQEPWYLEAGSGMTATLRLANEKRGYTLSDLGTYLLYYNKHVIDLERLVETGKEMLNVYSAIASDPRNSNMSKANYPAAMRLIRYLVSDQGQAILADFGLDRYGQPLFHPYQTLLRSRSDPKLIDWVMETAYFQGLECPPQYQYEPGDLYTSLLLPRPLAPPPASKRN